jgi:16S rRNA (guanine527-N7)-methyltransferase
MTEAEEFSSILASRFAPIGQLPAGVVSELFRHYCILERWNRTLNLTTVAGMEAAVVRHYCESLFLAVHLPAEPVSVLDVGSGGGFPGVPLAILRPDCAVTLAESHQRKAVFLREATRHLRNVAVAALRAAEAEVRSDWVVSRAVKWPEVLEVAWSQGASIGLLLGKEDAEQLLGAAAGAGSKGREFRREAYEPAAEDAAEVADRGGAARSRTRPPGTAEAAHLPRQALFEWDPPVHLPWGNRRVLIIGRPRAASVPRGTS